MIVVRAPLSSDVGYFSVKNEALLCQIDSSIKKWAIDLEEKVFLAKIGAGREDSAHEQYFIFSYLGQDLRLNLANRRDGDFRYWELIGAHPDLDEKEDARKILTALRSCLIAWDEFYAGVQSKFKF